ncbi:MAG: uridine diphosphate-N-acetylglucosamine-binding protein YvcK [Anaerolineaceae bacterium]|jgi:uncharacterized cofD-like protein
MRPKKRRFGQRFFDPIILKLRWLLPGIGVKRWIFLILAGTTLLGVGFAVLILDVYRTAPDTWWLPIISFLSLRFIDRTLRGLIFGSIGLALIGFGIQGLNRTLLKPFVRPGSNLIDTVSEYRRRERGPRIVVIGGGTGLSALLRGLKDYSRNITAVVTVADNGGSSGELRKSIGILPPGDIRNCLAALSSDEELLTQLFQYRFAESAGLNGHSMGNLLITALTELTGSFEEGVAEMGRVLAVQGDVFPSTLHNVNLCADIKMADKNIEVEIQGESQISKMGGKINRVWLDPGNPAAFPPTVQAILGADLIIIGPGSLYTSLLANLLVPDLRDAIRASRATKFYVCNVATQPGETDHFSCNDHVRTIEHHIGGKVFDVVICNSNQEGSLPEGIEWVKLNPDEEMDVPAYRADLVDFDNPSRHHSAKLARTIMDLYLERTGPLNTKEGTSQL